MGALGDFDQFDSTDVLLLEKVEMFAHPDLPQRVALIHFTFNEFSVFVVVNDENDTLICTRSLPSIERERYSIFIESPFWTRIIGKALTNAWRMMNDRGYEDAFQFRFRERPNEGEYTRVQLYAIASQIDVTELRVTREQLTNELPNSEEFVINEILRSGLDDWVQMSDVSGVVEHYALVCDPSLGRRVVLRILPEVLGRGLMKAGALEQRNGPKREFVEWSSDRALRHLNDTWPEGHFPRLGDLALLLRLTDKGRQQLIARGLAWE